MMSVVLWVLQVILALFFGMASLNQLFNFKQLSEQYVIYQVFPHAFWVGYAIVSLVCAIGLVTTRVWPQATPLAASVLAVQGLAFAVLYAYQAGFQPSFLMWATWTLVPVILAAFVAYARFSQTA